MLALYIVENNKEIDRTDVEQYSIMFQHNTRLCLLQ
jgi:hypothetical protein